MQLFPGIRKFINDSTRQAELSGYITTIADRRRYLSKENTKDATNSIIQG